MKTCFLGGTCNGSTWRDGLIPLLKIDYFNPVVPDWTPECQAEEDAAKVNSDFCLYVLTPKSPNTYSIAEVVDDSNKRPTRTVLCVLPTDGGVSFEGHQVKALAKIGKLVVANGAHSFTSLGEVAEFLNSQNN